MLSWSIAVFIVVSLYLGKRLLDARAENAALRDRVAALKRQLVKR